MKRFTARELYALVFGLFLGLCLWKFGNPVILDHKISPPASLVELWQEPWPLHWANWIFYPLAAVGLWLAIRLKARWPSNRWLWLLPLGWLAWQFLSAAHTVDRDLTTVTLWQFAGCVACYFLGLLLLARKSLLPWLLAGLLAAFTYCLVRAVDQRIFEYPETRQALLAGEQCGWTNYPPETVLSMKQDGIIITTNGVKVVNPVIMAKFEKGRVSGTLVYPNALAGVILLLWPLSLALVFNCTRTLKPPIRLAAIGLVLFLGGAAFFYSGSKLGWLLGMGVAGLFLLRLPWSIRLKSAAVAMVLVVGLGIFAVRFHHYFATGATSVSARLDYWRAAVETTQANPLWGTGPGTFQRPYAEIKSPESEMARLTHNDYLEQFSDSGIIGGLLYLAWISFALLEAARIHWKNDDLILFAAFAGLAGWFIQGFGEFSLYIPGLAWTAFTLLGWLIGEKGNEFDK
jgi:hypothetical protein